MWLDADPHNTCLFDLLLYLLGKRICDCWAKQRAGFIVRRTLVSTASHEIAYMCMYSVDTILAGTRKQAGRFSAVAPHEKRFV